MLERARLAMRRLLTMSNLFENLSEIYGDREALVPAAPFGYRLFPSAAMGYQECLRFTNLAAESFIRELDLKKGERAILCIPDAAELLLASAALIKAGGIVVPVDHELPTAEVTRRARGCGAALAVVDARVLAEKPGIAESLRTGSRLMASGPRSLAPAGVLSLDEAMDGSSGFFLPYTLKPSNVVGLFHTRLGDGSPKAVMVTNEGLLGPHLWATALMPSRVGDRCLHVLGLDEVAGMCSAVMGLCMGLRMHLAAGTEPPRILDMIEDGEPSVVMASSSAYMDMIAAAAPARGLSRVRLWLSAGDPLPVRVLREFQRSSSGGRHLRRVPAAFVEVYTAGGNATVLAVRTNRGFLRWPAGYPGPALPPNRMRVVGTDGKPVRWVGDGHLAVRGPAVTPGYWNDVEGTLAAKRDGWLHTDIPATTKHGVITLR